MLDVRPGCVRVWRAHTKPFSRGTVLLVLSVRNLHSFDSRHKIVTLLGASMLAELEIDAVRSLSAKFE